MRFVMLTLLFVPTIATAAPPPPATNTNDPFTPLVNPKCSHCVDEAKRRSDDLKPDDAILAWTRGYSDGGAIPFRFFLNRHRVISDSYGVFLSDPEAGYARGFAPSFTFKFHSFRNGIMHIQDTQDGSVFSALSGKGVDGPRKGQYLQSVPTLSSTWGDWVEKYPHAVAYQMTEKFVATNAPKELNADSVKSRLAKTDPRLKSDDKVLGVRIGDTTRAYPLKKWIPSANPMKLLFDNLAGENVVIVWQTDTQTAAAYKLLAHQPRKYKAPRPDKFGVSPADEGELLPDFKAKEQPKKVELDRADGDKGTRLILKGGKYEEYWDIAGRCVAGPMKGWTLEPLDGVTCYWFAWSAEHPKTEIYGQEATMKEIAGAAEFLRLLPKPWATVKAVDTEKHTITLTLEGEKTTKVWPVEPDAEFKLHGWWGRLEQFNPGQRVWVWLKLDKHKNAKSVCMVADEASERDFHIQDETKPASKEAVELFEKKKSEQQTWLRERWTKEGLPGTLTVNHVFSGELEVQLDHEAIRWGRNLALGDNVKLVAEGEVKAVVKHVIPWRERTTVRLVVGELATADYKLGQRVYLKVTPPAVGVDTAIYPPDIDRKRSREDRAEWFLASIYCVCSVGKDTCTGMYYTLASCNPNGCGAPGATRQEIFKLIDKGHTDKQIWDELAAYRGPLMSKPHLVK